MNTQTIEQAKSESFSNDDARFAAVSTRDSNADGVFYYSVSTTGIYCKPSCPSRTALRKTYTSTAVAWKRKKQAIALVCAVNPIKPHHQTIMLRRLQRHAGLSKLRKKHLPLMSLHSVKI